MTDDHASRRPQPGHWLLITLVLALVIGGIVVVARRDDSPAPVAQPTAPPSPSASPEIDDPACVPRITETGVGTPDDSVDYGFVYKSQCGQVARELRFQVTPVDAHGAALTGIDTAVATGGVLMPGAELAAAGTLEVPKGERVAGIHVAVIHLTSQAAADFSAWPSNVQVVDLTQGKPDRTGGIKVNGTVQVQPASAPACVHEFVLIVRDKSGAIIDAQRTIMSDAGRPDFTVWPTAAYDFAHTTIYAPQTPRTAVLAAGTACNGQKLS